MSASKTGPLNAGTPSRRPSASSVGKAPPKWEMTRRLSSNSSLPVVADRRGSSGIAGKQLVTPNAVVLPAKRRASEPYAPSPAVAPPVRSSSFPSAILGQKSQVPITPTVALDDCNISGVPIVHQLPEQGHAALPPLQVTAVGNQHTIVTSGLEITIRPTSPTSLQAWSSKEGLVLPGVVSEVDRLQEAGADTLYQVHENVLQAISPLKTLLTEVAHTQGKKTRSTNCVPTSGTDKAQETKEISSTTNEQGTVAVPLQEQDHSETGGVFSDFEATPVVGTDAPKRRSIVPPGANAAAPLPSTPMNLDRLNRSAAAAERCGTFSCGTQVYSPS
ncbi:hypothetical protein HPB51_008153 [Rhipicephalus microplus]|uniref:Uncharacterized protein n=1 Tax=Rhipicephalus microplus TaxID=6941 RepID=A0A9J6D4L1_RHIMP|nr:hypothetical protein HPB51_008153 [Rhipicephalus microplus]